MKNKLIEICKNAKKASNQVIDNKTVSYTHLRAHET